MRAEKNQSSSTASPYRLRNFEGFLPVAAGLFIILISLGAWQVLQENEARSIHSITDAVVKGVGREISTDMEARVLAIFRISERWSLRGAPTKAEWDSVAKLYVRHFPGIQSIQWIDPHYIVRWFIPFSINQEMQNKDLKNNPHLEKTLDISKERRRPMITGTETLTRGGKGFHVYSPIFHKGEFYGFIGGVFRNEKLFNLMLANIAPRYSLVLLDSENQEIYRRGHLKGTYHKWLRSYDISFRGIQWRLKIWPNEDLLRESRSPLPTFVLLSGLALGILFAWTLHLSQSERKRSKEMQRMNRELENEIVERKQAQDQLHSNERMYHQILDAFVDMVLVKGPGSRIIWANKAFRDYYGMTNEELRNMVDAKFNKPAYTEQYLRDDKYVFETGHTLHIPEEPVTRHDGVIMPFETVKSAIFDETGKTVMTVGVSRDITERKKVEADLHEKDLALENALDGISKLDRNGKFLFVNRAFADALAYKPEEMLGLEWPLAIHSYDITKVTAAYEMMLWKGKADVEARSLRKDGTYFQSHIILIKTVDNTGEFSGHYCFMTDITERKHKQLLEMKSQFISTASHELRTPLHSIKEGVSTVLGELTGKLNSDQKEFLTLVKRNVERLTRLINDLLDFQKLEAGAIQYHFAENDLNALIHEIKNALITVPKGKQLILELAENLPRIVLDADRITRVLLNLISNAIKFTPSGTIKITTALQEEGIRVSVADTGIGIKPEDLSQVFTAFHQVGESTGPDHLGTGLGLSISKRIVEQHGGIIWAESIYGKGSTFQFVLPFKPVLKD